MAVPQSHIDALQQQSETGTPAQQQAARQALAMHGVDPSQSPTSRGSSPTLTEEQAHALYQESGGDPAKFFYDPSGSRDTKKPTVPGPAKTTVDKKTGLPVPAELKTPLQRHVESLSSQLNTGSTQEKLWAKQALEKMGYQITMSGPAMISEVEAKELFVQSGGDPAEFYYDPSGVKFAAERQNKLDPYKVDLPKALSEDQAKAIYELSTKDVTKPTEFYYQKPVMYDTLRLATDIKEGKASGMSSRDFDKMFGSGSYNQALKTAGDMVMVGQGPDAQWVDKQWFSRLIVEERNYLKERGFDEYMKEFYRTDPINGQQYHYSPYTPQDKKFMEEYGARDRKGKLTGKIDWDKLHADQGAAMAADIIQGAKNGLVTKSDYKEIEKTYGDAGVDGARDLVSDHSKQVRAKIADKYLDQFMDRDEINMMKLARAIDKNPRRAEQINRQLVNAGYDKTTAKGIIAQAQSIDKYKYDPDTFGQHFKSSFYEQGTAKGVILDMTPFLGTFRSAEHHGATSGWTIASAVGDALIIIPAIRGVSTAVKSGQSLGRAVLNETVVAARGEILGPIDLLAHPKQALRSITAPFASFIPFRKTLPLASSYRGTYGPMSVSKVAAGTSPLVIRKAMEEAQQAMISGKKSGVIDIDGGGKLHYSSAGLQEELPGTVVTASPYGKEYKGQGLEAKGEGVFVADSAYLGLEKQTSTGKRVLYGFDGKDFKGLVVTNPKDKNFAKLLNDHGRPIGTVEITKILNKSTKKFEEIIEPGSKIFGNNGKVIGKTKEQPAFVIIQTNGMQSLPDWAKDAKDIRDLERISWERFGTGKYAEDLYPVFKQYREWIEKEGLLPKGTHLIPVLDSKGNQVILRTRGARGETIEMPMMQLVDKNWLQTAREVTKELGPILDMMTPKMSAQKMLSKVTDIPDPAKTSKVLAKWFQDNPDARLVGSTVEYLYTGKYVPHDIDMGAKDPWKAAKSMAKDIEDSTGVKINISKDKLRDGKKSARLEWTNKHGETIEMANIKELDDSYATQVIDGIRMETPASQLERTLKRMEDQFSGKGYMRFQRFLKSTGHDIDLGIGAKAPSWAAIEKLRIKGWKNTVTDIFNKDLKLNKRVDAAENISPHLADEVKELSKAENTIDKLNDQHKTLSKQKKNLSPEDKKLVDDLENQFDDIMRRNEPVSHISADTTAASKTVREIKETLKQLAMERLHKQRLQSEIKNEISRKRYIEDRFMEGTRNYLKYMESKTSRAKSTSRQQTRRSSLLIGLTGITVGTGAGTMTMAEGNGAEAMMAGAEDAAARIGMMIRKRILISLNSRGKTKGRVKVSPAKLSFEWGKYRVKAARKMMSL